MTFLAGAASPSEPPDGTDLSPDSSRSNELIALCALGAAVVASMSGVAPTGTGWWDKLLAAALAALFVVAASRADRVLLLAAAGLAATFVGLTPWLGVAIAAFCAAVGAELQSKRRIVLQSFSGALTVCALLHLRPVGFFGLSALIAGVAITAVLISGYRRSGPPAQARTRRAVMTLSLLIGAVLVIGGYQAVSIKSTATTGAQAARQGLRAARGGDTQQLSVQLERAQALLGRANDQVQSPLLRPLSLIPVAAQQLRSVATATEQGVAVAQEAAAAANEADLETLQLRQGQFDLDQFAAMVPRLESTVGQLDQAVRSIEADRSPWLLPPVDRQLDLLVAEVSDVLPEARIAAQAARVMPGMLGADAPRRYLTLFGSPGESREFGGFVGGYGLIEVVDGDLDLIQAGSINDLVFIAREGKFDDPDSYPVEYQEADPVMFPQNLTSTPSLSLMARAVRDIFPTLAGAPIDGVIYADPFALAAMTDFIGPVSVPGLDEPLNRQGVVDFIFDGQYRVFDDRDVRFETIGALATATAEGFAAADLPGPERLGEVLGPLARAGRLQIITYDDDENDFLASVLLQRDFFAPTEVDAFAVIQTNGTASKLDLFLEREIVYDIRLGTDRNLGATVDVVLESTIPADAPELKLGETDGTNQVLLSLYSKHELVSVTLDSEPHDYVTHREFGFFRYALLKTPVAPNGTATLRFELRGTSPPGEYRVGVWEQPLVNNDIVRVTVQQGDDAPASEQRELVETWLFAPSLGADE